ncbi:MAG: FRG domain-containing protein [Clostridia bacterium]|nr:FRG domain-containing protein [Clostridia bacterium]
MIRTEYINTIEEVMALLADQPYNHEIDRVRSAYFYHGLPDVNYRLLTSLYRNCKNLYRKLELPILRNFSKYASIDDPTLSASIWKQMIVGQHHGLPTRLFDWTRSPLIALHFANKGISYDKIDKRDAAIWRIDMRDVNANLPAKYADYLNSLDAFVLSVDQLTTLADSLDAYDKDMRGEAMVSIEPPSIEQRIISQYSFFSVVPADMVSIEDFLQTHTEHTVKYVISKDIRWEILDLLDQYNVCERVLMPGLDGISQTVARHYFVKDSVSERCAGAEDEKKD